MLSSEKKKPPKKLSREIMGRLLITAATALFFFGFLYLTADSIAVTYYLEKGIVLTEGQLLTLQAWIRSISLLTAVLFFLALFLFLLGQKMAYLQEMIQGVEALRTHRLDFVIPVEGDDELTELAESINFLSETERRLRQRETELQEKKERLMRELSHDIRTPLTAILAYSDYMGQKERPEQEEIQEYIALMQRKARQIKALTDRLLDSGSRQLECIEDGRLLMEQLAGEWEETLEEMFSCSVETKDCPQFSGMFDIQELRRIFDNLASNVEKYADREQPVELRIDSMGHRLRILQKNGIEKQRTAAESNQIGLESIRQIAAFYGGAVSVSMAEEVFWIQITLSEIQEPHL
ncbi:histidine kinase dimerization/phospho-acceptor domain-containing protein [Anaerotignum sp.]